jgi:MSHA biogenesis protein MshP
MNPTHTQRGFSLISAIFLLVVLAGMGAAMVTFSTNQHQSITLDVLGSRAYQAARVGVEWSTTQSSSPTTAAGTLWAGCATGQTFAAGSLPGTLSPFAVTVTCVSNGPISDDASTVHVYTVTSTANTGALGSANYVERQVQVRIVQ